MESDLSKETKKAGASFVLLIAETLLSTLVFLSVFFAFVFAAKFLLPDYHAFDARVFLFLKEHISSRNTSVMLFFSRIGNFQFLLIANCILISYYLFLRKHRWYALKIPAIALSSVSLMFLLKNLFERARPALPLLDPALGLSFPSGHAMSSVTFYGLVIFLISKTSLDKTSKIFLTLVLVLVIVFIGVSRIYLRVHYPTDVLGGYLAGLLWLVFSVKMLSRIEVFTKNTRSANLG